MGCCVQRGKLPEEDDNFLTEKTVPTYQVIKKLYAKYGYHIIDGYSQKEEMILMLINLLRIKPRLFLNQVEGLRIPQYE